MNNLNNLPWQRGSKLLQILARTIEGELERQTGQPFTVVALEAGNEGSLGARIAIVILILPLFFVVAVLLAFPAGFTCSFWFFANGNQPADWTRVRESGS